MNNVAKDLESYLQSCQHTAFRWRTFNCAHFVGRWVARAEKRDIEVPSLRDGMLMLNEHGTAVELVTKLYREPLPAPTMRQVGDVVLLPGKTDHRFILGICNGRYAAVLPLTAEYGELAFVDQSNARAAWRVEWRE
jgi:hypothetical protein